MGHLHLFSSSQRFILTMTRSISIDHVMANDIKKEEYDYRTILPGHPRKFTYAAEMPKADFPPRSGSIGYDWTSLEPVKDLGVPLPNSEWVRADPRDMYRYAVGFVSYPYGIPRDCTPYVAPSTKSLDISFTKESSLESLASSSKSLSSTIETISRDNLSSSEFESSSEVVEEREDRPFKFKLFKWAA